MDIKFYRTTDPNNKLEKTLELVTTRDCTLKQPTNILEPTIILHDNVSCNYAYISNFGRYYYVDKPTIDGAQYIYNLRCDPLMSHADAIKLAPCYRARSEQNKNKYVADSDIPAKAKKRVQFRNFPNSFSGTQNNYILMNGVKTEL